jgi:hypothetical protein
MTPAGKLQEALKKAVQQSGGQYRKMRWEGRRGCPDCLIWWTWPRAALVEVKAPGDRYSKLQEREVARMRRDGWPVYTVSSLEDVLLVVTEVRHGEGL